MNQHRQERNAYGCGECGKPITTGCYCDECAEIDADEELGVADLEERLDAAFARADEAKLNKRVQPK